MFKTTASRPLSDFVRNTKAHIKQLKATHEPQILTVNGEAAIVVQDAESYSNCWSASIAPNLESTFHGMLLHGMGRKNSSDKWIVSTRPTIAKIRAGD